MLKVSTAPLVFFAKLYWHKKAINIDAMYNDINYHSIKVDNQTICESKDDYLANKTLNVYINIILLLFINNYLYSIIVY